MIIRPTTITEALRYIHTTTTMLNRIDSIARCLYTAATDIECLYCRNICDTRCFIVKCHREGGTHNLPVTLCAECFGIIAMHCFRGTPAGGAQDSLTNKRLKRNSILCAMGLGPYEVSADSRKNCAWCRMPAATRVQFNVPKCSGMIHRTCILAAEKEADARSLAYHTDHLWQWATWSCDLLTKDVVCIICALHVSLYNKYWLAIDPIQI